MSAAAVRRAFAVVTAAAVLAVLPGSPAAAAEGGIAGRVTGPDGAPVADACVSAYPLYSYTSAPPRTTTADDGSYRVPDVPAGRHTVLVQPCGTSADVAPQWWRGRTWVMDALAVDVAEGQDTAGVDAVLVAGGALAGTVTDEQGRPVEGACVRLDAVNNDWTMAAGATARTDADGRYRLARLPEVTYRVVVRGCATPAPEVYAPGTPDRGQARTVTPTPGATLAGVDTVLRAPVPLSGSVQDTAGRPLADRCVRVHEKGDSGRYVASTSTGSDGRWRTDDVVAGTYVLKVSSCRDGTFLDRWFDGSAWVAKPAVVTLSSGQPLQTPPLVAPAAGVIAGAVVDDTGAAIPDPCAWAYPADQDRRYSLRSYDHLVRVDQSTGYRIGGLPTGRYLIGVGACQRGTYGLRWHGGDDRESTAVAVDVTAGDVTRVDLERPRAAFVTGTLRDAAGLPARGCARFKSWQVAASDSSGRYTSPPLYPREHRIGFGSSCESVTFDAPDPSESHTTLTLAPGTTSDGVDAVITDPALYLAGHVRDPAGDGVRACIEATAPGKRSVSGYADAAGAWRLDGLEPAAWTLVFRLCLSERNLVPTWYPGVPVLSDAVPVQLGATAVTGLDVVMREGARVVGTVTGPDGTPLQGACVEAYEPATGAPRSSIGGRTRSDGSFDLRALSPGAHLLRAKACYEAADAPDAPAPTYFPGTTTRRAEAEPVLLAVGDNPRHDWQLLPGGTLTGRLVDRDGRPVRGCVGVYSNGEGWGREVDTDAAGVFVVPGLGTSSGVRTTINGGCRTDRAILHLPPRATAAGEHRDLGDVFAPLGASISGQLLRRDVVAGGPDTPLVGICITAVDERGERGYATSPGEDGRYTLDRLAPGAYRLHFVDCRRALVIDEWYDDSLLASGAQPVTVVEDQDVAGIDAVLLAVQLPGVPREVVSTVRDSTATLTWREPADDGGATVESYVVREAATGRSLGETSGGSRSLAVPTVGAVTLEAVNRRGAGPRATATPQDAGPATEPTPLPHTAVPAPQRNPAVPAPSDTAVPPAPSGTAPAPAARADVVPLPPARVLDTRDGTGGVPGRLRPGAPASLQVMGVGGVPASGVRAVLLNTTATGATAAGHLTVYPGGSRVPLASSLNHARGQTVANLVLVPVGPDGTVELVSNEGTPHVVADVVGYVGAAPGTLAPLPPARVLDTRDGTGGTASRLVPGAPRSLAVLGRGGVPGSGVRAVLLNTTATGSSTAGHLTVFPGGTRAPLASSLNYVRGGTVANLVLVPVGADGTVRLLANAGTPHVVADVVGYVAASASPALLPLPPTRVLDTRDGTGGLPGRLPAGRSVVLRVTGRGGVPTSGVRAVLLNTTVTGATRAGHLTVYPGGAGVPLASSLNHAAGQTVANLVLVPVAPDGTVRLLSNAGTPHVVADVVGWVG